MKNTETLENSLNEKTDPKNTKQDIDQVPESLLKSVQNIVDEIADEPDREGLERTPQRVAESFQYFTQGYDRDPKDVLNDALYEIDYDEMVIANDIDFFSLCEHHLLPFYGKAHVAYIPDKHVVGLSKIARLVDMYARRLQVQERLTKQIATTVSEQVQPQGVGVVIEANHLCMMMRGVEKQNTQAITSEMQGNFREDSRTRSEFLNLIDQQS